jgi:ABC-type hemin transport system ATPase subunit
MDIGHGVDHHEADIVPVKSVLRAGIAETYPDLHRNRSYLSLSSKKPDRVSTARLLMQQLERCGNR